MNRAGHHVSTDLTRAELDVLQLYADGLTPAEVAAKRWVSELTVKGQMKRARRKLGVRLTGHAAVIAMRRGLIR